MSLLLSGILCIAFVLSVVDELFWQHEVKISVYTEAGEIPLYNESYALVVGNGSYTNGWEPLDGVLKDVRDVATALEKHGFTVTLKLISRSLTLILRLKRLSERERARITASCFTTRATAIRKSISRQAKSRAISSW